jgi:hypothetical protein
MDFTGRLRALDTFWMNIIIRLIIPVVVAGIFIAILTFNRRKKR